jgi:hypothetical protein
MVRPRLLVSPRSSQGAGRVDVPAPSHLRVILWADLPAFGLKAHRECGSTGDRVDSEPGHWYSFILRPL